MSLQLDLKMSRERKPSLSLLKKMKLRAHHVCCYSFFTVSLADRGEKFRQATEDIKRALTSQPDLEVTVIEGVDELCKTCPLCENDRCQSPYGNEEEVRKWDAILLKELGISFGETLIAQEWQALIKKKSPFKLCYRCKYKSICSIGSEVKDS
jgi:hypothetical protein